MYDVRLESSTCGLVCRLAPSERDHDILVARPYVADLDARELAQGVRGTEVIGSIEILDLEGEAALTIGADRVAGGALPGAHVAP